MLSDKKKVAIVGDGMVGMSFAYALLNQNICDELVLIDINKERAWGEAADLSHGLPFAPSSMKIKAGEYSDCSDADLVVICAGAFLFSYASWVMTTLSPSILSRV